MTMSDYFPQGTCVLWEPPLIGLHVTSDLLIAFAYLAIPVLLWRGILTNVAGKGPLRPFSWWLIAAFLCCGLTHVADAVTIWVPIYWTSGGLKALTAVISFGALRSLMVCIWSLERMKEFQQVRVALRELARAS